MGKAPTDPVERERRKLIAHLKYTNIDQRTREYEQRRRATRTNLVRSFAELNRATPAELVVTLIEDGLLCKLKGAPCVHPSCEKFPASGYMDDRTIGCLRATSVAKASSIEARNVFYRCVTCRNKITVNQGSIIYPPGRGGFGVTERTLAYWNMVHGAPMTLTAKQLRLSEDTVRSFYATARCVCVQDVFRMEQEMVFGARGSWTTDIECDEHSWVKWIVEDRHYYLVWVGIQQRGTTSHLFLRPSISSDSNMLPGIHYSVGEGKVPPLTAECLELILKEAFTAHTNAIMMADSAQAYQSLQVGVHGICEKHLVSHGSDEYTRSEKVVNIKVIRPISSLTSNAEKTCFI